MAVYQVVSAFPITCEGKTIPAGEPLATIESNFDASQLESLLQYKQASIVRAGTKAKASEPLPSVTVVEAVQSQDAVADTPDSEPLPGTAPAAEQSRADLAASEFPGLETRLALAIIDSGIASPEALRAKVDEGYDVLDIDGVGKKTAPRVIEWLDSVLPAQVTKTTSD
jgi:hypothetical protein